MREAMSPRVLTGHDAAKLRQQAHELIRRFQLPASAAEMLPGSLTRTETRCGKPNCHCATGAGHPAWTLTFMVHGRRRTERVPQEWAEEVAQRVAAGRALQEAVRDVLAANAERLVLARKRRQ